MSAVLKGVLIGVLLVALAGVGLVAAVNARLVPNPLAPAPEPRILVVASAPDESGTDLAVMAFTIEAGTNNVALLSTLESATVPGTSATTPRDALPFGGGDAVATALIPQTGGAKLEWVVVPSAVWADLVDSADGVSVDVPSAVNAYTQGRLVRIESGSQSLDGRHAVALAASVPYLGDSDAQKLVLRELTAGVSAVIDSSGTRLREAVGAGAAQSSLEPAEIPNLVPAQ